MDYYEKNALEYFNNTKNADMSATYKKFLKYVNTGQRILDVGCGSGRDLKYFRGQGFDAEGLEPSKELCRLLKNETSAVVHNSTVQKFTAKSKYHAIWACASLIHLQDKELFDFFKHIDRILFPGGIIYASGKNGISTGISEDGRFFLEFTEELLKKILEENRKLVLKEKWYSKDVTGRNEFRWLNFILEYKG